MQRKDANNFVNFFNRSEGNVRKKSAEFEVYDNNDLQVGQEIGAACSCGKSNRDRSALSRTCSTSHRSRCTSSKNTELLSVYSGKRKFQSIIRKSNAEKSLKNKKRIIKMLAVVVLEFFICWTPFYVMNTISLFNPRAVYNFLGMAGVSGVQLLAYCSACCNPITYCFMNLSFRRAFYQTIRCEKRAEYRKPSLLRNSASHHCIRSQEMNSKYSNDEESLRDNENKRLCGRQLANLKISSHGSELPDEQPIACHLEGGDRSLIGKLEEATKV